MGLNVGGQKTADIRVQGVWLHPNVGSYQLTFHLVVDAIGDENRAEASIIGADVAVTGSLDESEKRLGFARPEEPFEIFGGPHHGGGTPSLHLQLQSPQISALETLRDSGDLTFRLRIKGSGRRNQQPMSVDSALTVPIPQSDWIKKLRDAGARNVMLLEVPLPLEDDSEEWQGVVEHLNQAENQLLNGDYRSCIASCRSTIDGLGIHSPDGEHWAGNALNQYGSNRQDMSKGDREVALWAAIRHYAHPAHHASRNGEVIPYSRSEAQFILTLTATVVARVRADGWPTYHDGS